LQLDELSRLSGRQGDLRNPMLFAINGPNVLFYRLESESLIPGAQQKVQ
jgi:hypothetical protein